MRAIQRCFLGMVGAIGLLAATSSAWAQITINELIVNDRTGASAAGNDLKEFVELYNAGNTPIDLSNYSFYETNLTDGAITQLFSIPSGHTIAPGGYWVAGLTGVANVNLVRPAGMFTDSAARVLELRDNTDATVDAVAYEVYRSGANGLLLATPAQQAQIGSGYQAQMLSFNDAIGSNQQTSLCRFRDGRDNNSNGRDFGHFPMTPGASNNLPLVSKHTVPNVDGMALGSEPTQYNAAFVMPRVINPTVADINNARVLPASPSGGNAIVAWDGPAGGGNTVLSEELVNGFDIYAYFDTTNLNIVGPTGEQYEWTMYGIGTSDPRFSIADPTGTIAGVPMVTENASTGLAWFYQQYQAGSGTVNLSQLLLIDCGDGGNSDPSAGEWTIKQTIDVSGMNPGWFRLGIVYDPVTGTYKAWFGNQVFTETTSPDMLGQFYAGWREVITPTTPKDIFNPLVWDSIHPGDFDADGDVDGADFVAWQTNFPKASGALPWEGDADGDGDVDGADFVVWQTNFPFTPGSPGTSPVPEPTTVLLAGIFAAALALKKFRT